MIESAIVALPWLAQTLAVGGSLLLLASLLMVAVRQPSRRRMIGATALRIALIVPLLVLAPKWLRIQVQEEIKPTQAVATQLPSQPQHVDMPSPASYTPSTSVNPDDGTSFTFVFPERAESAPSTIRDSAPAPTTPTTTPPAPAVVAPPEPPAIALSWQEWLVVGYSVIAGLFLVRWLLAQFALYRLIRRSRPASASLTKIMESLAGSGRAPQLRVVADLPAPVCCGLRSPMILLPQRVAEASDEEALQWVFAHEISHLRRGDAWTAFWFGLAAAVYFPLPWFWRLKKQVSLAQEHVADAEAAALSRAEEYAAFLVSLSRLSRPARQMAGVSGVLGSPSELYRRITMLLDKSTRVERSCPRRWSWIATGSFLSLAIVLSGLGITRTVAAHNNDDATAGADDDQKKDQQKKDGEEKFIKPPKPGARAGAGLPQFPQFQFGNMNQEDMEKFQKDMQKWLDEVNKQFQQGGLGGLQGQIPQFQFGNMNAEELQKHIRKMMDDMQKNLPQGGFQFGVPNAGRGRFGARSTGSGRLGVSIEKPSEVVVEQLDLPKDQGLILSDVKADSPAAKAGLKANDIILEFNGKPVVNDPQEFRKMVADIAANKAVDAVVLRKGKRETIHGVTMPEAKAEQDNPFGFGNGGFALPNVQVFPRGAAPAVPANPFGNGNFGGGLGAGVGHSMSMTINNDNFSINSHDQNVTISVAGKLEYGHMKVNSVKINDGTDSVQVDSLDRVPEKYKEKVQALLKNINISK